MALDLPCPSQALPAVLLLQSPKEPLFTSFRVRGVGEWPGSVLRLSKVLTGLDSEPGSLEGRLCTLDLLRDLTPPECCWEEKDPQTLPRKQADWGTVRVQLVNVELVSRGLGPIPNLQELSKVAAGQPPPALSGPFPSPLLLASPG